jgi:hypothetical protein
MTPLGTTLWAVPGGRVPLDRTGREPEFTSFDKLSVLNAGDADAHLELAIFHPGRDPVGPYKLTVAARRCRQVRVNDLIEPEAVPLAEDYSVVVRSDVPVVVQFTRQDTGQAAAALGGGVAFAAGGG